MADNPAIRQRGQQVFISLFDGSAVSVKAIVSMAETTPGEASQTWADAGALCWIAYDGDPTKIEFVVYVDAVGQRQSRRTIKSERVGALFNTAKLNLSADAVLLPVQRASFAEADFGPDFNTG